MRGPAPGSPNQTFMNPWLRRLHLVLTIGGGFVGVAATLQTTLTTPSPNPIYYAMMAGFGLLYGYGMFVGLRLVERPAETLHLLVYYCLQVPWISSPLIAYRFTSGFHLSGGIIDGRLSTLFRLGSDWQFSFLLDAPWGIGVNGFALAMALFLAFQRSKPTPAPQSHA